MAAQARQCGKPQGQRSTTRPCFARATLPRAGRSPSVVCARLADRRLPRPDDRFGIARAPIARRHLRTVRSWPSGGASVFGGKVIPPTRPEARGVRGVPALAGLAEREAGGDHASPLIEAWIVSTSAWLGNTFSHSTRWASSSMRPPEITAIDKSRSAAGRSVERTQPLGAVAPSTSVSIPSARRTRSRSPPANTLTGRLVSTTSPGCGAGAGCSSLETLHEAAPRLDPREQPVAPTDLGMAPRNPTLTLVRRRLAPRPPRARPLGQTGSPQRTTISGCTSMINGALRRATLGLSWSSR